MNKLLFTLTFAVLTNLTIAQNPCDCNITFDEPLVCVEDTSGNQFLFFNNSCVISCLQFTLIDSTFCNVDTTETLCNCEINIDDPFICAIDSTGQFCYVPNACWANCLNLTIVDENNCEFDPAIDTTFASCLDNVNVDSIIYIQDLVLTLNNYCDLNLPECFISAPIFNNDSLYLEYIIYNCGLDSLFILQEANAIINSKLSNTKNITINSKVYPNPCNDILNIEIDVKGEKNISIYDALGRQVLHRRTSSVQEIFDISQLISAIYFIKVDTENGTLNYSIYKN
jgi:hypothetical protein